MEPSETRSVNDLYGLQNHRVGYTPVMLADGEVEYIVMSLHVAPIAESDGPLRALPAVCMRIEKAEAVARDLLKAAKAARGR